MRAQALEALVRKSGWAGAVTDELKASIACTRYQSKKFTQSYDDFVAYGAGGAAA